MSETFCQICRHPTPGHEPDCPVGTGKPVRGVLNQMQQALDTLPQGGLYQMGHSSSQAPITTREQQLWDLLDDIDTAFDAYRPDMQPFELYVQKKVQQRHQILVSDGYNLFPAK